jgi:hypothetical protein
MIIARVSVPLRDSSISLSAYGALGGRQYARLRLAGGAVAVSRPSVTSRARWRLVMALLRPVAWAISEAVRSCWPVKRARISAGRPLRSPPARAGSLPVRDSSLLGASRVKVTVKWLIALENFGHGPEQAFRVPHDEPARVHLDLDLRPA